MPFYYDIDNEKAEDRRTAERLLSIRASLEQTVPRRTVTDTLLLATWNIREFDSNKYGKRAKEAFYYMAEIISHFDLVAVQEVREDLEALERLQTILGDWWRFLVTDVTEGTAGNRERMAFLYDTRKVKFSGIAGEVVIPPMKSGADPVRQLARTPFLVGFEVGWFKFMLCTVHIYYGEAMAEDPTRVKEIQELAKFLAARSSEETAWSNNLILLGDFNIFRPEDVTFKAVTDAGFIIPKKIQELPSNVPQDKHYDQIAFIGDEKDILTEDYQAGVINYFRLLYLDDDEATYKEGMGADYLKKSTGTPRTAQEKTRYYKDWRTHQMSDHLPLWVELKVDRGKAYLERKKSPP